MLYIALAEAALLAVCVVVIFALEHTHAMERGDRARAYEQTLQTMANRVQRPEMLPLEAAPQYIVPEPEPDDIELVNTIRYEP